MGYVASNYDKMVNDMSVASINLSMQGVANNVKSKAGDINRKEDVIDDVNDSIDDDNYTEDEENDDTDCDVSLDGSWQRRGYALLNGLFLQLNM